MTGLIFNPYDRPGFNPEAILFAEKAAQQIREDAMGKKWLFLADGKHKSVGLLAVLFSRVMLKAFQDIGMKHLLTEMGNRASYIMYDAVIDGR